MSCLNDFMCSSLRSSTKAKIAIFHKYIFEEEGDRNNRRRLREFCGFGYDESSDEYQQKKIYVSSNLSERDLVSICNMMGISYDEDDVLLHIFRNLRRNHLFTERNNDVNDGENDDEEDDNGENSRENTASCGKRRNEVANSKVERSNECKENHETTDYYDFATNISGENNEENENSRAPAKHINMQVNKCVANSMTKFAMTFRDIEDSIRPFDGSNKVRVDFWCEEFEEQSMLMQWDNLQKFVFAKKSLRGVAKLFVMNERGLNSWQALKNALINEFKDTTNSALLHKQLSERKLKENESLQEYFYNMKDIANRGNIEDEALIQYVIDGINDLTVNKTILYGAKKLYDFKDKLKCYEMMCVQSKSKAKQMVKTNINQCERKEVQCYNCGGKGHVSSSCKDKEKGKKCFKCNRFGHISANCDKNKNDETNSKANTRQMVLKRDFAHKNVKVGDKYYDALVDTGSKFNIVTQDVYENLNKPKLNACNVSLVGFGANNHENKIKPSGFFKQEIEVDCETFLLNFYVVSNNCMDIKVVLGEELCMQSEIIINKDGLIIRKAQTDTTINDDVLLMKIDTVIQNNELDIDTDASKEVKQTVSEIISNYKPNKILTTNVEMRIILNDESPIFSRPRRLPFSQVDIVESQVDEWLKDGIIEISNSEFTSPVVLVKKRDGSPRLCIDFRQINKKIIKDHFPLPLIDDQLDQLQDARLFSTLDMRNGFFHVPVEQSSRKYTSFVTQSGQYQFCKVPFGLCNSPGVFQRHINAIFRELRREGIALPYIDDVIIPAKNEQQAMHNLEKVINTCRDYGLELNVKKCQFLKKKVNFLGYVIEDQKIRASPEKTQAVHNYKIPKTQKQLLSFLGLVGYFRKFIPNYSIIAKPLTDLTKQNVNFTMNLPAEQAFNALKNALCENNVLNIYNCTYETELHTDASIDGFGAVLLQKSPHDDQLHPIYYMSRKTTEAQRKFTSYELEILAVVEALAKFRVYLLGIKFKLVTDCNAFTKTLEKKSLCTRVARWILLLQEFDYVVEHRVGTRMKHVDALSRYAVMLIQDDQLIIRISQAQLDDENLKAIREVLKSKNSYNDYFVKSNVLYKIFRDTELIVVPENMEKQIISQAHERGHFAVKKTKELILKDYYISNIDEKIRRHIACCIPCILSNRKRGKQEGLLHPIQKEELPLYTFHIDFLGPLQSTSKQYQHILAVIDSFTKFCWLYPSKSTTSLEVITKLRTQSAIFGNPANIVSDRGAAFSSKDFQEYCESENIKHTMITTGLPRVNGQVERLNEIIISVLTKLSSTDPTKWFKHVSKVQQAINSTFTRSINTTPFELLVGTKMRTQDDKHIQELIEQETINAFNSDRNELRKQAKSQILEVQQENRRTYNLRRKPAQQYKVNDLAVIKRTQFGSGLKLKSKFLGPYRIIKIRGNNAYEVEKIGNGEGPINSTTCAEYMKPWVKGSDKNDLTFETNV